LTIVDHFSLAGRKALVIGGTSGIGREIALGYASAGAEVAVAGRRQEKIDAVVGEMGMAGAKARGYAADVTEVAAIAPLLERFEADHGQLDILVNCQGTIEIKPALELSEAEYDRVIDTNLKSVFFACTAAARLMKPRGEGSIINIASLSAHYGWANAAAYSISKWGVASLTQSLAAEWGEAGIRVNAISPGFFMTELNREKMPPERKAEASRRNAMKRFGELPELIGAAVYLASPAAAFVTGSILRVDGGYLATGI
jgi:NAD(P)-dependent dehydrogenase (short-subunit alcohol dehydrogenase family)